MKENCGWRSTAAAGLVKAEPKHANALASARDDRRLANRAIWADLPSGGEDHVETILEAFGESGRIGRDLWVLRTLRPAAAVRAAIAAGLSNGARFLIIDANHGRLAWSNLGLDAETKLRRIWDGGPNSAPSSLWSPESLRRSLSSLQKPGAAQSGESHSPEGQNASLQSPVSSLQSPVSSLWSPERMARQGISFWGKDPERPRGSPLRHATATRLSCNAKRYRFQFST